FVAHPNCQQLLTSIWYEGFPVWRRRNGFMKILLCCGLIACIPAISLYYLFCPRSKMGKLVRSPFMKFIYHSASFGCFLLLLVLASTRTEGSERSRQNIRGPPPSLVEWLIFFWVTVFGSNLLLYSVAYSSKHLEPECPKGLPLDTGRDSEMAIEEFLPHMPSCRIL
ncbi:Short transient receptor potential channel 5, partial [Araneus ventricosus]